jgi:hypothetical protein
VLTRRGAFGRITGHTEAERELLTSGLSAFRESVTLETRVDDFAYTEKPRFHMGTTHHLALGSEMSCASSVLTSRPVFTKVFRRLSVGDSRAHHVSRTDSSFESMIAGNSRLKHTEDPLASGARYDFLR